MDVAHFKPELTRPPDFTAFWKQQLGALRERGPVEFRLTPGPSTTKAQVWDLKYPSVDNRTEVWGWYAAPAGTTEGKKVPAVLTIPAFGGRRGKGPKLYPDAATLVAGYRGEGDEPWPKDWITRGLDRPEDSVFRLHYLNLVRSLAVPPGAARD